MAKIFIGCVFTRPCRTVGRLLSSVAPNAVRDLWLLAVAEHTQVPELHKSTA
jgi:hypothetical protein